MESSLKPEQQETEVGGCETWCLTEFQSESIGLEHDRPVDFVTSQVRFIV